MAHFAEFPEIGLHPEFTEAEVNELVPAAEKTIIDIWLAVQKLCGVRAFSGAVDGKYYVAQAAEEGEIPTGVVASISVRSIQAGGVLSELKTLYNVTKAGDVTIEKLLMGGENYDPQHIGSLEDVARFKAAITDIEQSREYARALGLLDVSQKEAETLLAVLDHFKVKGG